MGSVSIMMVSLGCDKNLVDTEMMMGLLSQEGFTFTDDEKAADVIIVNTCSFIADAKQESIDTLIELGELKKTGKLKGLIAAGCLAQRYHDQFAELLPEVDALVGTMSFDRIAEAVRGVLERSNEEKEAKPERSFPAPFLDDINRCLYGKKRILSTGGHYAYLKIAEGCDKNCTYCAIPKLRGKYRSFPMETLLAEAEQLAKEGVKELILIAQETTLYGRDLYGEKRLPQLITELAKIPGIRWIRLMYCYPEEVTKELAELFATEEKLLPYVDLPIQHASDSVLKRMGRRTTCAQLKEKIEMLRSTCPDICLRTTLICGFPGESEEDVNLLADFIEEIRFDRLGVFTYSLEEDTPAALLEDQIEEEEKENRRAYLMELQQSIAFEKAETCIGRELTVLIEGRIVEEDVYVGRSYMDAPGVDGMVFVHTGRELLSGDFVSVRITGSHEYDLIGELIE